jgi:hypothetical protein
MEKAKLNKKIEALFNYYKKTYNLKTKLIIRIDNVTAFSFVIPFNYIICGKKEINQIKKVLNKKNISIECGKIRTSNFEEIICYHLLHEIGHAIDYNLNQKRFIAKSKNYEHFKSFKKYQNHPLEKRADKFAYKEIQKFYEKIK